MAAMSVRLRRRSQHGLGSHARRRYLAVGAPIVGLSVLVGVGGALWAVPRIERDLEARAKARLAEAGVRDVGVEAHGRDLHLVAEPGVAAGPAALAGLRGVRHVIVDLAVPDERSATGLELHPLAVPATSELPVVPAALPPAPSVAVPAPPAPTGVAAADPAVTVTAIAVHGHLIVTGTVRDSAEVLAIRQAVAQADGRASVALELAPGRRAAALPRPATLSQLLRTLARDLASGEATFAPDGLVVDGIARDPGALAELRAVIEQARTEGVPVTATLRTRIMGAGGEG
jgi:hypothetical protein